MEKNPATWLNESLPEPTLARAAQAKGMFVSGLPSAEDFFSTARRQAVTLNRP
jgi:hypothetical protein